MTDERTLFIRPPLWLPIAVAVIAGGMYIAGKYVETRDRSFATISVSGEGRVFTAPDIAEVSMGMQTGRQASAEQAMTRLKEGMTKVLAAVQQAGVEEKDIRTENFYLNPVYDWTQDQGQIFRGFEATQSLRIKVRDLDKVSEVIGAGTTAGANQAGGVQFTVDEPEAKRAEARQKAIDQAKQKAKTLADSLGMKLGKIRGFDEGSSGGAYPPIMMRAQEDSAMGGATAPAGMVPLPAGEQEIVVNVSITYELE